MVFNQRGGMDEELSTMYRTTGWSSCIVKVLEPGEEVNITPDLLDNNMEIIQEFSCVYALKGKAMHVGEGAVEVLQSLSPLAKKKPPDRNTSPGLLQGSYIP